MRKTLNIHLVSKPYHSNRLIFTKFKTKLNIKTDFKWQIQIRSSIDKLKEMSDTEDLFKVRIAGLNNKDNLYLYIYVNGRDLLKETEILFIESKI
jgi:hypothetical protein